MIAIPVVATYFKDYAAKDFLVLPIFAFFEVLDAAWEKINHSSSSFSHCIAFYLRFTSETIDSKIFSSFLKFLKIVHSDYIVELLTRALELNNQNELSEQIVFLQDELGRNWIDCWASQSERPQRHALYHCSTCCTPTNDASGAIFHCEVCGKCRRVNVMTLPWPVLRDVLTQDWLQVESEDDVYTAVKQYLEGLPCH